MGGWTTHYNHLPEFEQLLIDNCRDAVDATAEAITDAAKSLVPAIENPGPFATSALKTALHWSSPHRSDYAEATSAARHVRDSAPDEITYRGRSRNEDELSKYITPEEPVVEEFGQILSIVLAPLDYAFAVELGGFSEEVMPGRAAGPFMAPAAEEQAGAHTLRVENAVRAAAAGAGAVFRDAQEREAWENQMRRGARSEARRAQRDRNARLRETNAAAERSRRDAAGNLLTLSEMMERTRRDAQDELDRHASGGGA